VQLGAINGEYVSTTSNFYLYTKIFNCCWRFKNQKQPENISNSFPFHLNIMMMMSSAN